MKFSFDNVVVDPETHVINVADREKRLEPKLIALLCYLAQNSQQVVTRQQITEAVWPNVVVVEESVTQAIFVLRNALNDDAKNPRYIETIPRKGYRFLAAVAFAAPPQSSPALSRPRKYLYISLLGLGVIFLGGLLSASLMSSSQQEIANILPVTKMAGAECCMAINNRHEMVFINVVDKTKDLYVKDLATGIQQRVTQDDWQKGIPLWLDDNTLIYPRCANKECQIVRQTLHHSPEVLYSTSAFIGEITATSANPNMLIFNEETEVSEFISLDLRSGTREKLRALYPDLPPKIFHPIIAKDAKQLYFVNLHPKPKLMVLNFSSKNIATLSNQFDEINSFSLNQKGQLLIAGIYKSAVGLWSLPPAGGQPSLILRSSGDEKLQFPLEDPKTATLYYQSVEFDQNIAMASVTKPEGESFPDLNSTGVDYLATLSKDEQFVYFISNRTGFSEVWRYDIATKQSKPVTNMKLATIDSVLVSNDGQRFSATYIDNSQATLGVFSVHNGELLASAKVHARPLSWSWNDSRIYVKDEVDSQPVLLSYDSQTLIATEIQKNAGIVAQESQDKKKLIFFDFDTSALVERDMATAKNRHLITLEKRPNKEGCVWTGQIRIDANNSYAFLTQQNKDTHQLWQYSLKTADTAPRKLMDIPKDSWVTFISTDGAKVLYDKQMPAAGSIMKINFH